MKLPVLETCIRLVPQFVTTPGSVNAVDVFVVTVVGAGVAVGVGVAAGVSGVFMFQIILVPHVN